MNKSDKIFVAGHRGLVGSAIVRNLESKGYTNIVRILLGENLFERIDAAQYSRCVFAFAIDAWVLDETIIGSINQCISIEKEQFCHIFFDFVCKLTNYI